MADLAEQSGHRECLVYLPHSYSGRGPAETCAQLLAAFPAQGWKVTVHVLRARQAFAPGIEVAESAGTLARHAPFAMIERGARARLDRQFARAIDAAPPGSIAWFWPDAPVGLVRRARDRGLVTVREMINSPWAHAKPVLDRAFMHAGLPPTHGITAASIARETEELAAYDFLFASNPEVEAALAATGVAANRILPTSFGWSARRFGQDHVADRKDDIFRTCFVGSLGVRKGVPVLLEAWKRAGISGELVLAGPIETGIRPLVDAAIADGNAVRWIGARGDIAALFAKSDVFVFPTFEEGGPQVTYEAAAMGLPVVTTPMGAARLVVDGETGLVVPPGEIDALAAALRRMASDAALRTATGAAARQAAQAFEYRRVGMARAGLLAAVD